MDWITKAEQIGWVFVHVDKGWIVKSLKAMGNDGFVLYDGNKCFYVMYYMELLIIKDQDEVKKYLLDKNLHIGDMDKVEYLDYKGWYIEDFDDSKLNEMADVIIKQIKE